MILKVFVRGVCLCEREREGGRGKDSVFLTVFDFTVNENMSYYVWLNTVSMTGAWFWQMHHVQNSWVLVILT
jgi:hypothetical protein